MRTPGLDRGLLLFLVILTLAGGFLPLTRAALWDDAVDLGGGWRWLDWFGYFSVGNCPWIYHLEHEWLYPFGESTTDLVFWDNGMGDFWWTGATAYPFLYRFSDGAWLWYQVGSSNPRLFYNFNTSMWESY